MFLDRLLNSGNAPVIEASARFAAARHRVLAENIANVDTPGYVQKDLSITKFREMLTDRIDSRSYNGPGMVGFGDINGQLENPTAGILFHDQNNRSMEQLMTDGVKNALFHNMMLEMLRKQFGSLEMALKERVGEHMLDSLDIGASALKAQRSRMDTIAGNVANINTTRNAAGDLSPYRRRFVVFAEGQANNPALAGVHLHKIEQDMAPFRKVYDPGNKDAGPDGYVQYPNVDLAIEQVNMLEASRAYEANVTMIETTKAMIAATLRLIA